MFFYDDLRLNTVINELNVSIFENFSLGTRDLLWTFILICEKMNQLGIFLEDQV